MAAVNGWEPVRCASPETTIQDRIARLPDKRGGRIPIVGGHSNCRSDDGACFLKCFRRLPFMTVASGVGLCGRNTPAIHACFPCMGMKKSARPKNGAEFTLLAGPGVQRGVRGSTHDRNSGADDEQGAGVHQITLTVGEKKRADTALGRGACAVVAGTTGSFVAAREAGARRRALIASGRRRCGSCLLPAGMKLIRSPKET